MIRPSTRRRDAPSASSALELHRRLERRDSVQRRLSYAAVAALVGSVAAWLLSAPAVWHLGATLLAALLGALLPVRGGRERALQQIAGQAGLAYETALERGALAPAERPDPHGFLAAVSELAVSSATRVVAPAQRPWWLPVAALALLLVVLPLLGLGPPLPGRSAGGAGEPAAREAPIPPPPAGAERSDPEQGAAPFGPDEAVEPVGVDGGEGGRGSAGDPGGANAAPSDGAALSRFLDDLRERPDEGGERQPEEGAGGGAPQAPGAQGAIGQGQLGQEGTESERANAPGDGAGDTSQQSGAQTETGAGNGNEGGVEGDAAGADAGGAGDQPTTGVDPGEDGNGADGSAPGEGPGAGQPQLDPGIDGGSSGDANGELGDQQGDNAGGAGASGGATLPSDGLDQRAGNEPDRIEGQLGDGPENLGGTIQLPGEGDAPELAPAQRDAFRRAAEQAVREGRIPLEYQEVIRNYFR